MFLRQPARPCSSQAMFERLGFANPRKRITHNSLNYVERSDRNSSIFIDPKPQIFNKLGMENRQPRDSALTLRATSFVQVRLPCAGW
jgi:hypothetical protein